MIGPLTDDPDDGHPVQLPWYAAGTADASVTAEIERHLVSCARCRDELRMWKGIGGVLDERGDEPHVAWMDLIAFGSGTPTLPVERRARIEAHVADCPECRSVLDDLREIEATPPSQRNPWKTAFVLATAACVLLAVVAGAALTRTRGVAATVEGGNRVVLEPAYRGSPGSSAGSGDFGEVNGRGPWCLVLLLADSLAAGDYRFEIRGGPPVAELDVEGTVTVDVERTATLWLRGPLEPGRYQIRLRPVANDAPESTYEFMARR